MDVNYCDGKSEGTQHDLASEVIPRAVVCCPLCEEEFRQPKILPCLHSYCQQCLLEHLAQATNTKSNHNNHCPECNTAVFKDMDDISNLSDNFFVRRLLDPIKTQQKHDKQCRQCSGSLSGANDPQVEGYYCVNCEEHLCESCTLSHREENETSSHKVEPMDTKGGNPQQTLSPANGISSLPQCCEYYDPLDVGSLFCVNCDILTCSECCAKNHRSHRCTELSVVAVNFENRVDEPLLDLEDGVHQLSENLTGLAQARDDLLTRQAKLRDSIVKRKEFLVEMIESYAQTVIAEVDRQVEQKLTEVEQERENTKYHISSINAVLNFTDNLLAYGTDEEKVSQRKKIGGRIRELSEMEIGNELSLPTDLDFIQPEVTVETICEMFGELTRDGSSGTQNRQERRHHPLTSNQTSIDSGHFSEVNGEMTNLGASLDGRRSSLSSSQERPGRARRKSVQFDNHVTQASYETEHIFHLDDSIREFPIPSGIERDCIKGMGINNNGDIIIGAVHTQGQCIYIVEKRGIIRGKVPVEGWQIHSVSSDGKVSMIVTRGNNRYKVRVLAEDCNRPIVDECHIQCYGFNFVTANSLGQVIIAANRYGKVCGTMGKAAKSGGNIAIHDKRGHLLHRFTNETYQDFNLYVLEKPCSVAVDSTGNIYVADAGSHLVAGFSSSGDLLFTFGNSDTNDDEIYEGPDSVALDYCGNLIVTDKKANRIDILTVRGQHKKTLCTRDTPKFVSAGLDKQIMVTSPEGLIQFYEYMHL